METALAIAAAIIAWIAVLWVQRPNLVESVRPEIVLKGWTQDEPNCLRFATIKNVGRGTAFNLHVSCTTKKRPRPVVLLSSVPNFQLIETNQELDIQGEIKLLWDSVEPKEDTKYLNFDFVILWWDSINQRHLVRQSVMVDYTTVKIASKAIVPGAMPPGVSFGPRERYTESVWWLKRKRTLRRVPGLARFLPSRY